MNEISYIEQYAFRGISAINKLKLNSNLLTSLRPHYFLYLPSLKILNLRNNGISEIVEGAFGGLDDIRHIYLDNNLLTEINGHILRGTEKTLEALSVNYNYVSLIDSEIFRMFPRLNHLDFIGNLMLCNCQFLLMTRQLNMNIRIDCFSLGYQHEEIEELFNTSVDPFEERMWETCDGVCAIKSYTVVYPCRFCPYDLHDTCSRNHSPISSSDSFSIYPDTTKCALLYVHKTPASTKSPAIECRSSICST